ncbi:hypothetical protein [Sphaerisporangium rhizosphaerae]|uniref:ATP-binding protein n=1 Tax=Sphaerisporangium rhizosphaerae TaxID=2269375 RepID=A0ABW2P1C7_9ACTN
MRAIEIEDWARRVAERVTRGGAVEDSRVELKRDWPDPTKAARRIAGHCNASAGDTVLWIIGLDEDAGVIGASNQDTAPWWAKVKSQFDGQAPTLQDIGMDIDGRDVLALAFETDRAPFVVRNSVYGKQGAGPVEREVPWRDGTSIRSATRADLIRLLLPIEAIPSIEVIHGSAELSKDTDPFPNLDATLVVYAALPMGYSTVLPNHQAQGFIRIGDSSELIDLDVTLRVGRRLDPRFPKREVLKPTVFNGEDQIILEGPGFFQVRGKGFATAAHLHGLGSIEMHVRLRPAGNNLSIAFDATIPPSETTGDHIADWSGLANR